jgi:hypothetical protein
MAQLHTVEAVPAPARGDGGRELIRWICTTNPFYVISAGLFLAGLLVSFGDQAQEEDTWALMAGLAGYTLLLAGTAGLLVRFGHVWDDIRTVLLLVVLMFLATSVTFDDVIYENPALGSACYLLGMLWAVVVSEGVLRAIRLRLPAWFRLPYYLILGLFFLYPLAVSPLLAQQRSERLMWALFGFSAMAGLVFLTLLPAIRRGPAYVLHNGSPWRWPLYPWVLFGLLAAAVPGRAYFLCWMMHPIAFDDVNLFIFGPYFLVPFGVAVAVLLLEIGIVSGRRELLRIALAAPLVLVILAIVGHQSHHIYQEFLRIFSRRLGGDPLFLTLLASAGFYVYAAYRKVPLALDGLTAALVALALVSRRELTLEWLVAPQPVLLLATALQLALGFRERSSVRCLLGSAGLVALAALAFPATTRVAPLRGLIIYHLMLMTVLVLGTIFDDPLGRLLRTVGSLWMALTCAVVIFVPLTAPASIPPWLLVVYPPIVAAFLAGYGLLLGHRSMVAGAGLISALWVVAAGWRIYRTFRLVITGLDFMAVGLALFAVAIAISLGKSAARSRWIAARQGKVPEAAD